VVAKTPVAASHYEWVARASCRSAFGQESDTAKTIIDDIYDTLPQNACVRDSWKNDWTTKLSYTFSDPHENSTVDSLLDDRSGSCGDWSFYILGLCNVQGIADGDGLKLHTFKFNADTQVTHPWQNFRVKHSGINHGQLPLADAHKVVDKTKYPYPDPDTDVHWRSIRMWWHYGTAFSEHAVVFLDVDGNDDSLYDPSFHPSNGMPKTVPWPGAGEETYTRTDNFMDEYFISACPYLYGNILLEDRQTRMEVDIHTDDFDREGANPADIKFKWEADGGKWK
jgi:hypothetical protein